MTREETEYFMKYGFGNYLKERMGRIITFLVCVCLFGVTFFFYRFPLKAVLYPASLCALVLLGCLFAEYGKVKKKHQRLCELSTLPDDLMEVLKGFEHQEDRDYRELMQRLLERAEEKDYAHQKQLSDTMEYFTTWVHQIKTPISSMRLRLEGLDSEVSRALSEDLMRIEQYVEMVLTYLRLDSETTDYMFRECRVDAVSKATLRRLAGQFIGRGLKLAYEETELTVVTDEKWLAFVLEQILSNALKYTPKGGITIGTKESCVLYVKDTGLGIAPEDLPRIFEKGYTGYHGREDKRASGLGLYLCKRICDNLGIRVRAESTLGEGTCVYLDLEQHMSRPE